MGKRMTARLTVSGLILLFSVPAWAGQALKNIIILTGDRMGVGHVPLARRAV